MARAAGGETAPVLLIIMHKLVLAMAKRCYTSTKPGTRHLRSGCWPDAWALKPAGMHAPPCGQRTFALWCAHAETFRHRCGARSSKPVAGLAVCGRFDPYTSPPINFVSSCSEKLAFFTPVFPGFFCFCARCARGQPVAAGPGAELFF